MKRKKLISLILVFGLLTAMLTGCLSTSVPASSAVASSAATPSASSSSTGNTAEGVIPIPFYNKADGVMVIRFASNLTSSEYGVSPTGVALKTLVDYVAEKSNGSMVINVYAGSQLASGNDNIVGGITNGSFEMTNQSSGNWGDYTTAFAELNVPFLYDNPETLWAVMDGQVGENMAGVLSEDLNCVMLGSIGLGMRHITNSVRPITQPSDLSGMKLRIQSDTIQKATFEAFKASIVSVSYSELFTALQQKLCDAQENPLSNINSQKFYEVQKYLTLSSHGVTESIIVANTDWLNSLTPEQRTIIEEGCREATVASRKACADLQEALLQKLKSEGMVVNELTDTERQQFVDIAKTCWSMSEDVMGSERYSQLTQAVSEAEAKLK